MAEGKWIPGLGPDTPLAEAAHKALSARLQVVGQFLRLALHEPYRDPEHVHQLRVGTRRAAAALNIFEKCLPRKVYRKAKKQLRALRRAAGQARDWDVFLIGLVERPRRGKQKQAGMDFLFAYALGHRLSAQAALEKTAAPLATAFAPFEVKVLAALRQPDGGHGSSTLLDLARPLLLGLVNGLHQAAAGDLEDYAHLHCVRILGKRLRYAMEVFADCFGPTFRETVYPEVEEMQEILGRANDSHTTIGRMHVLRDYLRTARPAEWKVLQPEIVAVLRYHQRRLPQERRRFLTWWKQWQHDNVEAQLLSMVGGFRPERLPHNSPAGWHQP
jgi:CHAD domain-containing protein